MDPLPGEAHCIIQLSLETGPEPAVRLSLCSADLGDSEKVWAGTMPAEAVGLPNYARGEDLDDGQFALPAETVEHLRRALATRPSRSPLLLQLVEPIGYLGLVPWERLFAAAFDGPVLRLPTVALDPREPTEDLEVLLLAAVPNRHRPGPVAGALHTAIRGVGLPPLAKGPSAARGHKAARLTGDSTDPGGSSSPAASHSAPGDRNVQVFTAEHVQSVVEAILAGSPRATTVHVVTTVWNYLDLRERWRDRGWPGGRVVLHDPRDLVRRIEKRPVDNRDLPLNATWLQLGEAALHGEQADVVHLVCHADLYGSRVRLVFADAPARATAGGSRYASIEATQALLNVVGAWSLAITSPPGDPTTPQLRLAATRLAEVRPGPVSFTDLTTDVEAADIVSAYRFLFATQAVPAPHLRSGMIVCEPHRVRAPASIDEFVTTPGPDRVPPDPALVASLSRPDSPAWIAAVQRLIEQYQVDLARLQRDAPIGSASPVGQQTSAGVRDAIVTIQDLVARYITDKGDGRDR